MSGDELKSLAEKGLSTDYYLDPAKQKAFVKLRMIQNKEHHTPAIIQ